MQKYSNCTWIMSGEHVGQVLALDMAYSFCDTEWLWHSEDDYKYLEPGFMEDSIEIMTRQTVIWNTNLIRYDQSRVDPRTQITYR